MIDTDKLLEQFPKVRMIPIKHNGEWKWWKVSQRTYDKIVKISYENQNNKQDSIKEV